MKKTKRKPKNYCKDCEGECQNADLGGCKNIDWENFKIDSKTAELVSRDD